MKISSVSNNSLPNSSKNNTKASFKAKVQLGDFRFPTEPMKEYAQKLIPSLEKLDDNLQIIVSGAEKSSENSIIAFFELFKKSILGIKFDVKYIDPKLALQRLIELPPEKQLLKDSTVGQLKKGNPKLLAQIKFPLKFGKFHFPKEQTPQQFLDSTGAMVKQETLFMPNKLLENNIIQEIFPNGSYTLSEENMIHYSNRYKGLDY